jgi:hypothetical protein
MKLKPDIDPRLRRLRRDLQPMRRREIARNARWDKQMARWAKQKAELEKLAKEITVGTEALLKTAKANTRKAKWAQESIL